MPGPTDLRSNQVDRLVTKDQDLHGRRTRNTSDAILDTDYVNLRQLKAVAVAVKNSQINAETSIGRFYSLSSNGTISIAADITARTQIVTGGRISSLRVDLKVAPTGADVVIEVYQSASLLVTLTLLDGTTSITATATQLAAIAAITVPNYWRLDIQQVGSTYPGSDLVATIGVS